MSNRTEEIKNPFLAAETAAAKPVRSGPVARANGARSQPHAASSRPLVIDDTPHGHPADARPGSAASIPGLERQRPRARLQGLRGDRRVARRLAVAGICAAVLISVLLAVSAVSGGGTDRRLLAARRTIVSLSDANRRLQGLTSSLSAAERQLQDGLQAARTQLQATRARLAAVQARQHGHRKGRRT